MDTSDKEREIYSIKAGDVFLTRTSETVDELCMSSVAVKDYPNATYSGFLKRLRPISDKAYPKFMALFFRSRFFRKTVTNKAVMTLRASFNEAVFNDISVDLPPIEDQRRIGDLFYDVECKTRNNNAIISELEAMAKDIYDYWFVQFDFPDENGRPYKSSGGKMVWNEDLKREIPEKWNVKTISSLVSASRGISYSTESITGVAGVPMINLASFNVDASYKPAGLKTYSGVYSKEDVLHPFDLIMCNTQQTDLDPKKDIIGKTMLVPDLFDSDIVASHHITRLHTEDLSMRVFLNATGKTTWFHKAMSGHCSGTSILGLDTKHALEYKLAIPEKSIRLSFSEKMIPIEKQKCVLMRENAELTSLRDWLLPMLMNGQVKIGNNTGDAK